MLDPSTGAGPVLQAVSSFGPYFAWEPYDGGPDWRPLDHLRDTGVLAERVAAGRRLIAGMAGLGEEDIPQRVIASTIFLGLASRLLSPVLAAAAVGTLPVADPGRMWWRPVPGGPAPIAWQGLVAVDCVRGDPTAVAAELTRTAVRGLVEPVLDAFRHRFAVSPQVLWGNVASALGGAVGMIADAAPQHAERCAAIVERMLAAPPLRGTGMLTRPDPARARWFLTRRNCCLYYRIPGGGTCGDCVLTPEEVRRQQWQAVLSR